MDKKLKSSNSSSGRFHQSRGELQAPDRKPNTVAEKKHWRLSQYDTSSENDTKLPSDENSRQSSWHIQNQLQRGDKSEKTESRSSRIRAKRSNSRSTGCRQRLASREKTDRSLSRGRRGHGQRASSSDYEHSYSQSCKRAKRSSSWSAESEKTESCLSCRRGGHREKSSSSEYEHSYSKSCQRAKRSSRRSAGRRQRSASREKTDKSLSHRRGGYREKSSSSEYEHSYSQSCKRAKRSNSWSAERRQRTASLSHRQAESVSLANLRIGEPPAVYDRRSSQHDGEASRDNVANSSNDQNDSCSNENGSELEFVEKEDMKPWYPFPSYPRTICILHDLIVGAKLMDIYIKNKQEMSVKYIKRLIKYFPAKMSNNQNEHVCKSSWTLEQKFASLQAEAYWLTHFRGTASELRQLRSYLEREDILSELYQKNKMTKRHVLNIIQKFAALKSEILRHK